jgi:succinyl-diaminopimelate desuccinylase
MQIAEDDVIPILKRLIQIKTENPPGKTIEAVEYLVEEFEQIGIRSQIQEYAEGRANIIAEYGDSDETIILTGHLDTVPAGNEEKWKYPPFEAREVDGKIFGRGSTDMKGAVAAFVAVVKKLKENQVKLNKKIIFLGTADEEIGMDGSQEAKKSGIMEGCKFVVIGEPTELQVGVAEKGTLWVVIKIRGESAHGSTPHLGINAIEGAAKLIPKMKNIVPDFEHKILGKSTLNIGKISGGTLINVVPEYCEFRCDYRLVADDLREGVKTDLTNLIEDFNRDSKAKAEIEIVHEIPAIELTEKDQFFESLKQKAIEAGKEKIIGVNYGTDGAMLVPEYGTPFVIMGPGKLDQLHVTDEYTEKQEVLDYANIIYDSLIENFG